jgi:hypothetical protein
MNNRDGFVIILIIIFILMFIFINNNFENFNINSKNMLTINFKPNKLYYGLECNFVKNDCFYTTLTNLNFHVTNNIKEACLIVPCSYETTEKEIIDLENQDIKGNKFGKNVRIFMLNNTDHMVSKISLWNYLKNRYGNVASNMIPHTWDLQNVNDFNNFKNNYSKDKMYITKNNHQRQEGLEIHTTIETIEKSKDKYLLVQELLQDPYCINGRKINLRVYVLVIRDTYNNLKIMIYRDGFMYYTAELFEKGNASFAKNITTGYIDRQVYIDNPLTHNDFRKYLDDPKRKLSSIEEYFKNTRPHIKLSDHIFSQIYNLTSFIFDSFEEVIGNKTSGLGFQLYGIDIAINDSLRPMIMEINKGPDLNAKDGRDKELKLKLSEDILKSVDIIPNKNNNFMNVLEKVNLNGNIIKINNLTNL